MIGLEDIAGIKSAEEGKAVALAIYNQLQGRPVVYCAKHKVTNEYGMHIGNKDIALFDSPESIGDAPESKQWEMEIYTGRQK